MEEPNIQQLFFQKIKESSASHLSIVDEIATLLNISNDSVYRRMRGEKVISLDEVQLLCSHYKISIDQLFSLGSDAFIFQGMLGDNSEQSFDHWLANVSQVFQMFNTFNNRHLSILMKDIPPFVHFQVPELAMFKCYFWMKSILHYDSLKQVKFTLDDEKLIKFLPTTDAIIKLYHSIPMTEIWNVESLNSSIRQINFYHEAGLIENVGITKKLFEELELLINHIERQAEAGVKFGLLQQPHPSNSVYRMFVNELILGDNTYLATLEDKRIVFLNHSVLYFVATSDERFTATTIQNLQNLERKSTMISGTGEKERTMFFNNLRRKIRKSYERL